MQSQDRAHRLGQKRVVKVYRLLVQGTVEEYQLKTQLSKTQLSNIVLDGTSETAFLSSGEIGNMNAMLHVHKTFTETASVELLDAGELPAVAYAVRENLGVDQVTPEVAVGRASLFAGKDDCLMGSDKQYLNVEIEDDLVEFGGGLDAMKLDKNQRKPVVNEKEDPVDICGEDSDEDGLDSTFDISDRENDDAFDGKRSAFDAIDRDDYNDIDTNTAIDESQQTDVLLADKNADSRFIVSSNEPKNVGRRTFLKQPEKLTGGVNCGLDAVSRVNLEDSQPCLDEDEDLDTKVGHVTHAVSGSRTSKLPRSDSAETAEQADRDAGPKRRRAANKQGGEPGGTQASKAARPLKRAKGGTSFSSGEDSDDDFGKRSKETKRDAQAGSSHQDQQTKARAASSAKPPARAAASVKPKKATAAPAKKRKAAVVNKNPFGARKTFTG